MRTQGQDQKTIGCREGKPLALLATIPHSGTKIPPEATWLKSLPLRLLMEDVDAWTDKLYGPVLEEFEIPYLVFEWHRYSLDINRFAEDISENTVEAAATLYSAQSKEDGKTHSGSDIIPKLHNQTEGEEKTHSGRTPIPKENNKSNAEKGKTQGEKIPHNQAKEEEKNYEAKQRVKKSPSDIHWHKSTKGHILMKKPISHQLHHQMIKKYFTPFHQKIQAQLDRFKQAGYKKIYLLDLHSMPSVGLSFHKDPGERRADIVIGDNQGQAAEKPFTDLVLSACRQAGFTTALNQPYSGGAITQRYGQPDKRQQALQLELNRSLYMDEVKKQQRSKHFKLTQDRFRFALSLILKHLREENSSPPK